MNLVQQFESTEYLCPKHKSHIESRGLLNYWSFATCRTVSADEASVYLGYAAKSGGILFVGATTQFQFRPDKPWKSSGSKKAPKYRTPVGEYDAFLPQHPTDKNYWEPENLKQHCYRINDHPYLLVTEGPFKAISGCSNDLPTIALMGISMGLTAKASDLQNKRYLVPTLEAYARAGFGFIIAFDADAATNPNVIWEQRKLGHQLLKFGVPVRSVTAQWEPGSEGETKGMDDFIQRKGIEEFRRMLMKSVSFQEWESNLDESEDSSPKNKIPLPQELGAELAEELRDQLCYSDEHKSWMKYELRHKGVWAAVNDDYVLSAIDTMCQTRGLQPNNAYCANVLGSLKRKLFVLDWLERPSNELLPFEDGVLSIESNTWQEHAPGFRLTWSLPRSYKGSAVNTGWAKINDWMNQATDGNRNKKDILIAFIAASLRGMASLHKFLMLTGPGGTGKGLYSRLTTMVVGERNTWIGNLEDLTKADKVADLQTKRLAVFDDQEKYTGNLSNFRSLTGGGKISGRQLYKSAVDFRFSGLALITSNQPCFPASGLSWLKRRIIQQGFEYTPIKRNPHLERELEPELSAFTQYLLSIPVTEIERILAQEGTGINDTFWADRVRADPMASWVNDCIIHDTEAQTAIGADKDEWKDADYVAAKSTLFGSYNNYCRRAGYSAKGKNNFSADLVELCREVLEWKDVAKQRSAAGMAIKGLRLRTDTDQDISTVEDLLSQSKNVDLGLHGADRNVDLQFLPHKACVDYVDLNSKLAKKNGNTSDDSSLETDGGTTSSSADSSLETDGGATSSSADSSLETDGGTTSSSADSSLETDGGTTSISPDQVNTDAEVVEVLPSPEVYTVYTSHTEQDIQPTQSLHSGQHSDQHSELNEDELDLLQMIRLALAEPDPELTRQAAADILPVLKKVCDKGAANREKIWAALTEEERSEFTFLAKNSERPTISQRSPKPSALGDNFSEPEPEQLAPEPALAEELAEPEPAQIAPEPETIAHADAEKLREIATVWWDEYFPEQLQTLITQMFGWGAPGIKYDAATIATWLATEAAVVRERIGELIRRRSEGFC
ncbi:DUF3854 domain-containing protein [Microcoleus sp. B3-D7]